MSRRRDPRILLADGLELPLGLVTQTTAILAKRRAGKSYTMRRLAEQVAGAGQQIVLVDPKGDQWGIRSSADGEGPGLPIVILGGEHGDAPLEASGGEIVARLVVEERVSVLLDLSAFRKSQVAVFMTGFLETLYRLKAREAYRTPVLLVIDEADAVAPQRPQKGEERMLGAAEDIVRRGGQRGIGCVLVTQRAAVLNKNVLTQAQILILLRTIAPQDLQALGAWVDVHGTAEERKLLFASLPSLPIGDAWVWSPGWPTTEGIFRRVHVLPITTFDSGATPDTGGAVVAPRTLADVDVEALSARMADTLARAKADDPKVLRARIAELERAAAKRPTESAEGVASLREKLDKAERRASGLEAAVGRIVEGLAEEIRRNGERLVAGLEEIIQALAELDPSAGDDGGIMPGPFPRVAEPYGDALVRPLVDAIRGVPGAGLDVSEQAATLPPARQRVVDALYWLLGIGRPTPSREVLAFMAGASSRSGAFRNNLGALRTAGLIDYPTSGNVSITEAGKRLARKRPRPLTSADLHAEIARALQPAQWALARVCLEQHPRALDRAELARRAGVEPTSGAFRNNLGRLRSLGIITYPASGQVRADDGMFL